MKLKIILFLSVYTVFAVVVSAWASYEYAVRKNARELKAPTIASPNSAWRLSYAPGLFFSEKSELLYPHESEILTEALSEAKIYVDPACAEPGGDYFCLQSDIPYTDCFYFAVDGTLLFGNLSQSNQTIIRKILYKIMLRMEFKPALAWFYEDTLPADMSDTTLQ